MAGGSCSVVTFVEIIGGDESLHHQNVKTVSTSGEGAPQNPTSVLLCTLSRFRNFETMNMNLFNYYGLEQYLQNNMPVQKIS